MSKCPNTGEGGRLITASLLGAVLSWLMQDIQTCQIRRSLKYRR